MMSFKQKTLFAAVASASALLAAGSANAVYVNNDGLGQALVYPYYTVRAGNTTLLSVVNTTDQAKAVKVRFLDGKNTAEVLDFNLFLSPKDVWTGAIMATADGAMIATKDKSCTNPKLPAGGQPFRNFQFVEDGDVTALQAMDRTREGYVEILEMATIPTTTALGKDVTHVSGTPKCSLTNDANATSATGLTAPSGGLFGSESIVNFTSGYSTSVDATALDGWHSGNFGITASGSLQPSIASGGSTIAVVNNGGNVYVSQMVNSLDAVSATMMHSNVMGEYAFTSDGAFGTDWVLTMPTKRQYVFDGNGSSNGGLGPFESAWSNKTGLSCDLVSLSSTDREEYKGVTLDDFSPKPPGTPGNSLCYEANVIGFGAAADASASAVLGSKNFVGISPIQNAGVSPVPQGTEGGWLDLQFDTSVAAGRRIGAVSGSTVNTATTTITPIAQAHTYVGLPVIGFAVSHYKAGQAASFDASTGLRFKRTVN
jgi:hypothetical protein